MMKVSTYKQRTETKRMRDDLEDKTSLVEELQELCEAVGYRLGVESYGILAPIISAAGNFKFAFTDGFRRGWQEARESHKEDASDGSPFDAQSQPY